MILTLTLTLTIGQRAKSPPTQTKNKHPATEPPTRPPKWYSPPSSPQGGDAPTSSKATFKSSFSPGSTTTTTSSSSRSSLVAAGQAALPVWEGSLIDVNSCTLKELKGIPKIGAKKAQSILDHRKLLNSNGHDIVDPNAWH